MKFFLYGQRNSQQSREAKTQLGQKLLDLLGREQANISLHSSLNKVTVHLPTLSNGIYIYKYMVDGIVISTGKLIKE